MKRTPLARKTPLKRKRMTPRRTTSPRCFRQRCHQRAEIGDLCVAHAEKLADKLFSTYIRERDGTCTARRVLVELECDPVTPHAAAHIVGRSNHRTRFDKANVHRLCAAHHVYVDQMGREGAKHAWAVELMGPAHYAELMARSREPLSRREATREALAWLQNDPRAA